MRIKELDDMLRLVDDLPPEYQRDCVRGLQHHVEDWEARSNEPPDGRSERERQVLRRTDA